jgi:hypothetical protein
MGPPLLKNAGTYSWKKKSNLWAHKYLKMLEHIVGEKCQIYGPTHYLKIWYKNFPLWGHFVLYVPACDKFT